MARFINIDYPAQHGGVIRMARGFRALGQLNLGHAVLHGLAVLGSPVRKAYGRWVEVRRQRAEDEKLWNLALTDARIMADLSRAMSKDALRDTRGYL